MAGGGNRRSAKERGTVLIAVALLLVALIGFGSLVVDIGNLYKVRSELQNASDSSSLAAAQELDRSAAGIDRARESAKEYASKHYADQTEVEIDDEDIVFGHYDPSEDVFTALGSSPSDPQAINAVRVFDQRAAADGNPVLMFLAPVFGIMQANVNSSAVAIGGGPASDCGFPVVVADCSLDAAIESFGGGKYCDFCMKMQNAPGDNAAWSPLTTASNSPGGVGSQVIADRVRDACFDGSGNPSVDPDTGLCNGGCNGLTMDDEVSTNNGNFFNQAANGPCKVIEEILLRDGTPKAFTVKVPVLQSTPGTCDAQDFNASATPIAGFATMEIYGVRCGNAATAYVDPSVPSSSGCSTPSGKWLLGALRCDLESTEGVAGGGYFGLDARHVRLVR